MIATFALNSFADDKELHCEFNDIQKKVSIVNGIGQLTFNDGENVIFAAGNEQTVKSAMIINMTTGETSISSAIKHAEYGSTNALLTGRADILDCSIK
jgi:ribosomal protein S4E